MLIGTLSGCCFKIGERDEHIDAIVGLFAHADDAARADFHAGFAHARQRI